MARIVDAVRIDDHGTDERAEIDQVVPIAAVAREPRRLDAEYSSDRAGADARNETLKARTIDNARPGPTEVVVDRRHGGETHRLR